MKNKLQGAQEQIDSNDYFESTSKKGEIETDRMKQERKKEKGC